MRPTPSISVLLLAPLVVMLESPAAREAFLGASDLTPEQLADPDARVSASQFCVAWAELRRLSGDPQIALRMAERIPPGAFGVVEYVCRCARTLGEALRHWVRYLNLLDDAVLVGLVEEGDEVCLRVLRESEAPAPASHELCFALLVARARALSLSPVRVTRVDFAHRAPGDPGAYRRSFDAPVHFGAPSTQLLFPRSAFDAPLATADPHLLAILSRHADELQEKHRGDPPLTAQVQRALRSALRSDEASVEQIAARLGMTARSLQRRLKDENQSFQTLREGVRHELAVRYLDDDLAIAEISFLLGFSEPSAFFRAFKRWTGLTPIESRARRRAALAP